MATDANQDDQSTENCKPWVTVSSKNSRRRGRHAKDAALTLHDSPSQLPNKHIKDDVGGLAGPNTSTASVPAATHTHIEAEHSRVVARWREQSSYSGLVDLVRTRASSHASVTRAVCLGAGSFGGPLDFGESIRRAHLQTEAFLTVVKLLSKFSRVCWWSCVFTPQLGTYNLSRN